MGRDPAAEYRYTPPPIMAGTTAERLVDELELINRHVWVDVELDREQLRVQTSMALSLACAVLDALPPAG